MKEILAKRLAVFALALAAIVGVCAFAFSGTQNDAWADDETTFLAKWDTVSVDGSTRTESNVGNVGMKVIEPIPDETLWQAKITSANVPIPPSVLKLTTNNGTELFAYFNETLNPVGNDAQVSIQNSEGVTGFTSAVLYPLPPAPQTVTVTFNLNGFGECPNGTTLNEDRTATIEAVDGAVTSPVPTDPDNDFGGWFTDESLTTPFNDTAATSMTVYAKWTPKESDTITVTFDMNGHGDNVTSPTEKGKPITLIDDPAAEGYTFKGWTYDKEGKQAFDSKKNADQDTTLYAQWEKNADPKPDPDTPSKPSDNPADKPSNNGSSNGSNATKPTKTAPTDFTIVISKTDAKTGKALSGAEFTLADKAGNVVDTWTSDGTSRTYTLDRGTSYVLTETKAPTGYSREKAININFSTDDGKEAVKIDQGGKAVALPVNNDGNATLNVKDLSGTALKGTGTTAPKTGDSQNMPLASLCFGAAALIAGGIAATAYRKRQEQ